MTVPPAGMVKGRPPRPACVFAWRRAKRRRMNDMSTEHRATKRLGTDVGGIAAAAEMLRAGQLVAFPTETVYGLGADATDGRAVAGIYAAKGRPSFNPLIAHVATVEAALALGQFDAEAEALARAFWPDR